MEKGTCSDLHFLLDIVYKVCCVGWLGGVSRPIPSHRIDRNTEVIKLCIRYSVVFLAIRPVVVIVQLLLLRFRRVGWDDSNRASQSLRRRRRAQSHGPGRQRATRSIQRHGYRS